MEERFRNLDYQNWKPVRTLGTDSYGTVYEIARDDGFGMVDHAALKVLSIPAAPEDFDALVAEGRTPEEVTALLHRQVETIARQLMAVDAISDEPNLLRCEDHVIREHPDGRGWDIYVRTELLPSLPDYLRNHPHGEADIIRLGAGLCSALETCHRRGIVHGDIKPRNVFVGGGNFNEQVTYKLGDFGMAQFSAVDNTNDFMAPEVLCGAEVSPESDLYSVGMVLYWALNERRIPFVPLPPTAVEASDLAIAREQRLRGDPLPEPLHGSQALKNVVMRACADDPAQRYASVEEFRAALLAVARRAAAAQPQQAQAVRREAPAPKAVAADTFPGSKPKAQRKAVPVESEGAEKPHNAKKTIAIVLGSLVVVALVVLIIVMALQGGKSGVDSITLDHESAEIAPQDTLTLKATVLDASGQELTDETLTWSSSNAAVATVKDGVVTGVTEGKAKITVKAGKRSADCTITVTNDAIEVKSLKLDKDRAEMQIGDSLTLTATMQPANAPDDLVSWASSDPNIATVKKGIVVATSSGSVTITASAGSCTATCQITVQAPSRVDSVTAETASATLDLGGTKTGTITFHIHGQNLDSLQSTVKVYAADGSVVSLGQPVRTGNGTDDTYSVTATAAAAGSTSVILQITGADGTTHSAACTVTVSRPASSGPTRYPPILTEPVHGALSVSPTRPKRGDTVTITPVPDQGYQVEQVTVTQRDGTALPVTDHGNGTYTFSQPSGRVTITVTFSPLPCDGGDTCPARVFSDLDPTQWYHEAIDYVLTHQLMAGVSQDRFAPQAVTTRAQAVTLLWRLEGCPAADTGLSYADVADTAWYREAVGWADAAGIAQGTSPTTFFPDAAVSREQMAVFFLRYAQYKGYDITQTTDLSGYQDAGQISGYARDAVAWAAEAGLLTGVSQDTLLPLGTATRAQTAAVLMRFCTNPAH